MKQSAVTHSPSVTLARATSLPEGGFYLRLSTYSKLTKQSLIVRCRGRTLPIPLRFVSSVATRHLPIERRLNDYIILSRAYETVFDDNPSVSPWLTPPFTQGRLKRSVTVGEGQLHPKTSDI